jgi:hypothetical protein
LVGGVEGGELRADVAVPVLVESLLVLVAVCVRWGTANGMHTEDVAAMALELFLGGARQ